MLPLRSIAGCVLSVFALGCTEAGLEVEPEPPPVRDDKLTVAGSLCTPSPDTRVFPLRVLFVIDGSESMRVSDPPDPLSLETGRERAVREAWEPLVQDEPEALRVGIMRFSAEAQLLTVVDDDADGVPDSYFTADPIRLQAANDILAETDRTTNFVNALSEAHFALRTELGEAEQESLPLSTYVVMFLSDGIPDTVGERGSTEDDILGGVRALRDLADQFRVGRFEFHTAFLSSDEGAVRDRAARELLQDMAEEGGGSFRNFSSGESLSFVDVDFEAIRRVFTLKSLSAVNLNSVMDADQVTSLVRAAIARQAAEMAAAEALEPQPELADQDPAAGLEEPAEVTPVDYSPDLGPELDAAAQALFVDLDGDLRVQCGEPMVDSDGDGLADLLEAITETDPLVDDTDDDGLRDRLEWSLEGLDPLDPLDARCILPAPCTDGDGDGFCDCVVDVDVDGVCDCADDPDRPCADDLGHDCIDVDMNGDCDCPDVDRDGLCDYSDRDGDGLHDCEEIFHGTAQNGNDTDADGLVDLMETRLRSNPVSRDDKLDIDLDRALNGAEVMAGTDPWCDDTGLRSRVAYRYTLQQLEAEEGRSCYEFEVDHITLVPTAENTQSVLPGNGWNRILVYAGDVPLDDPDSFANYRVACVMAAYALDGDYRAPASGRVVLNDEDFVQAGEFDAEIHCKWP